MEQYEIHIVEMPPSGVMWEPCQPKYRMIISKEQKQIIEEFAIIKKDKDFNTVYILNELEFKIVPHFEINHLKQ